MTDQPSCSEIAKQCLKENCIDVERLPELVGSITEALEAKQKTIEEITGKLHTAHDLENKLCALLINHAGETGQSEGAVEVLERKLRELESLRAEVATLKRIDDVGIITNQNQHSEIDKLKAQLSRLKEIMTHLVLIREALSNTWEEGV